MKNNCDYDFTDVRLTIEEIRSTEGFEDISDEEADYYVDTAFQLSSILFEYYERERPE